MSLHVMATLFFHNHIVLISLAMKHFVREFQIRHPFLYDEKYVTVLQQVFSMHSPCIHHYSLVYIYIHIYIYTYIYIYING